MKIRDEVALMIFNSTLIKSQAAYFGKQNAEDLIHETIIAMMGLPDQKLQQLKESDKVIEYAWLVLRNQDRNKYSDYSKLKAQIIYFDADIETNETPEDIEPKPHHYYPEADDFIRFCDTQRTHAHNYVRLCADVIHAYYTLTDWQKTSFREFSRATGINHKSISQYYNEMKRRFKEHHENRVTVK